MPLLATIDPVEEFDVLGVQLTQTPAFFDDGLAKRILAAAAHSGVHLSVDVGGEVLPLPVSTFYNPGIGAPTEGTYSTGDVCSDSNGSWWQCTSGGSPGSWTQLGTDVGSGFVLATTLGQPSGVATLDSGSRVAQSPAVHTHALSVQDAGGTVYAPTSLNFLNSGLLTFHAGTSVLDVDLTSPTPVKLRVGSTDSTRSITNSSTLQTVTSLTTPTLAAGSQYDIYAFLPVTSTTAAGVKVAVTGPSDADMTGNFWGAQNSQTSFDSTVLRFPTTPVATNGPQQFGGFGDSSGIAMTTVRYEGSIKLVTAGTVQVRFAQTTAAAGVTTSLSAFHAKLFLFPA
jgi:hypothetical protein